MAATEFSLPGAVEEQIKTALKSGLKSSIRAAQAGEEMKEDEVLQTVEYLACRLKCGYLGNPQWHNMCSRCFYYHVQLPALTVRQQDTEDDAAAKKAASSKVEIELPGVPVVPTGPVTTHLKLDDETKEVKQAGGVVTILKGGPGHYAPVFTTAVCVVEITILAFSVVINEGLEPIDSNPTYGPSPETLVKCGALYEVQRVEEMWRLLSAMLLHSGLLHIVPNLAIQWPTSRLLEKHWGPWRVCLVHFLSGLGGNIGSATLTKGFPDSFTVGASGACFGLLAALPVLIGERKTEAASYPTAAKYGIPIALVVSLVAGVMLPGMLPGLPSVDTWAHAGGIFAGLWAGWLVRGMPEARGEDPGSAKDEAADPAAAAAAAAALADPDELGATVGADGEPVGEEWVKRRKARSALITVKVLAAAMLLLYFFWGVWLLQCTGSACLGYEAPGHLKVDEYLPRDGIDIR